jgi:hypothetical protein
MANRNSPAAEQIQQRARQLLASTESGDGQEVDDWLDADYGWQNCPNDPLPLRPEHELRVLLNERRA